MLKEDWKKTDRITSKQFNEILQRIEYIHLIISQTEISLIEKKVGDFLYTEDLEKIENILVGYDKSFEKRHWCNMTTFDYKDINRWSKAINKLEYEIRQNKNGRIVDENDQYLITENDSYIISEMGG